MLRRLGVVASVGVLVVAAGLVGGASPAAAASSVTARGVELAPSASCRYGDVDIDYAATGAEAQTAQLSSDAGVLAQFDVAAFKADYDGIEHILTQAKPPVPAPGTVLTVYVTIGTNPPASDTTAEFVISYRCTAAGNDSGGANEVISRCVGPYGSCARPTGPALLPRFTG
jgi:hypothetical protein